MNEDFNGSTEYDDSGSADSNKPISTFSGLPNEPDAEVFAGLSTSTFVAIVVNALFEKEASKKGFAIKKSKMEESAMPTSNTPD
jgi:hypothetical protein